MRIGVFTNAGMDSNANYGNSFLDALRRHPRVSEVIKLNANNTRIFLESNEIKIELNGEIIPYDYFDLVVNRRWKHDDIEMIISLFNEFKKNGVKVFDNNQSITHYLCHKKADSIKFVANNICIPKTYLFNSIEQFYDVDFPLVMKGINASQGSSVFKVNSTEEISNILIEKNLPISNFIFQEIIDYKWDLRLIVVGDEVIGAMRRIPQANEFRANYSLGGNVEKFEPTEEMIDLAVRAAKATDLDISGVDILVDQNDKLYILETNRNPGFEGIIKANGEEVTNKVVDFIFKKVGI